MARVLLIDDDADLREALGEWLAQHGHAVETVGAAAEAGAAARRFVPDVILLDGVLPDAPGTSVAGELSAAAPVVFLSGLAREQLPPGARVLQKPVDLERLERTILDLASARA